MRFRISVLHYVADYALSIIFNYSLRLNVVGLRFGQRIYGFYHGSYKRSNTQIAQWINVPLCPIVLQRNRFPTHRREYLQRRCVSQF